MRTVETIGGFRLDAGAGAAVAGGECAARSRHTRPTIWRRAIAALGLAAVLGLAAPVQAQSSEDNDPVYETMGSIAHLDTAAGEIRIGEERFRLSPNLVIRNLPEGASLRRGLNVGYVVDYDTGGDMPVVTHLWLIE